MDHIFLLCQYFSSWSSSSYLQDPHGPNVALFVGSLPPNLNEKQYETILLDYLDDSELFSSSLVPNFQFLNRKKITNLNSVDIIFFNITNYTKQSPLHHLDDSEFNITLIHISFLGINHRHSLSVFNLWSSKKLVFVKLKSMDIHFWKNWILGSFKCTDYGIQSAISDKQCWQVHWVRSASESISITR